MGKVSLMVLGSLLVAAGSAWGGNFVAPGDGTVYDSSSSLLWQQTENARMSWEAATDRCEGLTLAGRSNWRLPTKEELLTLVDRTRTDPAVDIRYFPKTKSTAYWTSTREKERIWGVGFSDGEEFVFGGTDLALYVRCVADAVGGAVPVASAPVPPKAPAAASPAKPAVPVKTAKASSPAPVAVASPETAGAQAPLPDPADTLRKWASAWEKQDVAAYLSFYGPRFAPPGKVGRGEWEKQRHRALTRPKWIKLDLGDLEVDRSGDQVRLEFVQAYRSDVFRDKVRKAIVLGRDGDRWAIVSEETLPPSP